MIDQHTLNTLEYPKIIALIAGRCLTPFGRSIVEETKPMFDSEAILLRQRETEQMQDIIGFGSAFPLAHLEDTREHLRSSQVENSMLAPEEIRQLLELIEIGNALQGYARDERENFPDIAAYLTRLRAFPELTKEIHQAIDETGAIKDSASGELRKVRRDLGAAHQKITQKLQKILAGRSKQAGWQDDVITQRNDRYVIPVVAGQYKSDSGILHDRSQSGATFYVEPQETVELNNRIHLLYQEERAEIVRILRALTHEIAIRADALLDNTSLIGSLDALHAAAAFARKIGAHRPKTDDVAAFDLIDARHPLLLVQADNPKSVIPLSLRLDKNRQAVVITGPNTGGKTIALKTVGLLTLMAQSGWPIPADRTSTVGLFTKVYADIGDEQSIELSLSTFSSHVKNIVQATSGVNDRTLVLLDEIGAGTDPKEGAALAEAVVMYLIKRGARLVSSTHYSQLKTLALDHPEIENASLEFDRETLAPTYRLQLGIPGSSYALEIAGRLGMPKEICERASESVGSGERSLADLIASLESELAQVREDKIKLSARLDQASELENKYRTLADKFDKEITETKRSALEETEHLLESARKETERLVAEIRKSQAADKPVKDAHRFLKKTSDQVRSLSSSTSKDRPVVDASTFQAGDSVRILSLNQEGVVDEVLAPGKARIRVGSMNTVVELRNLQKLAAEPPPTARRTGGTTGPATSDISPEIHLRGMTVDEAMSTLDKFLDSAVISGLHQVYVIHGKGTGTLRRTLTEYLKQHSEVDSLRLGNWNEGGAGVTVVKLKR